MMVFKIDLNPKKNSINFLVHWNQNFYTISYGKSRELSIDHFLWIAIQIQDLPVTLNSKTSSKKSTRKNTEGV